MHVGFIPLTLFVGLEYPFRVARLERVMMEEEMYTFILAFIPRTPQILHKFQLIHKPHLEISFCHYREALSVIPFSRLLTVYSCAYLQAELREK